MCREASFLDETLSTNRAAAQARRQAVEDIAKISGMSYNGCPRDIETAFDKEKLSHMPLAERAKWAVYRQALEQEFARLARKKAR